MMKTCGLSRKDLKTGWLFASASWWQHVAYIPWLLLLCDSGLWHGDGGKERTSNTHHNLFAVWSPLIINHRRSISLESHSRSPQQPTHRAKWGCCHGNSGEGLNSERPGSHPAQMRLPQPSPPSRGAPRNVSNHKWGQFPFCDKAARLTSLSADVQNWHNKVSIGLHKQQPTKGG